MTAGASVPAGAVISINGSTEGTTTSLKSPIKINTKGEGGGVVINSDGGPPPSDFTPPISILGTTNPTGTIAELNASITLKSGQAIDGNKDADTALISTAMAEKNSLKVGSTFEAYKKTLTVAGIFESGTEAGDNFVIMSLPTLQRLSGNTGVVTEAVATVDSVTNIASTTAAVKKTIGSSNADVTSSEETVKNAIKPLQSIQSVSLYSLIGAVAAGGVIILLTMIMIVRERKREIGVIKAIGSSNQRIMLQFMAEALTLTVLGAVVGLMIGVAAGGPVTQTLVDNTANSTNGGGGPVTSAGPGSGTFHTFGGGPGSAIQGIRDVQAQIGWTIILDGLGAAILIALIGSALASFFIAKVKPAEVLRSE
jgi:putative ABC transport system permease protein